MDVRGLLRTAVRPLHVVKHGFRGGLVHPWRRSCRNTVFIAVTGSHGKSTATVLIGRLLATVAPTQTHWDGNHYPDAVKSVLETRPWRHSYAVTEVSGHPIGNIEQSNALLRQSVGVVTAIGGDHRSEFRSFETAAAEKSKLVRSLPADGLAVLNADDPHVAAMASGCRCRVVTFGRSARADLRLLEASSVWPNRLTLRASYKGATFQINSRMVGTQWSVSILAALLTAFELGADLETCIEAIESFEPLFNRLSVHPAPNGAIYVFDGVKGSYFGIETCLGFLDGAAAPRKTVIFGAIADRPGGGDGKYYRRVARLALERADRVFFTGKNAERLETLARNEFGDRLFAVTEPDEVARIIVADAIRDEIIYVKASAADNLQDFFPRPA